jgi:uncharacterized integral membrane protein (TIGR00697 family)
MCAAMLGIVVLWTRHSLNLAWRSLGVANLLWMLAWLAFRLAIVAHPDVSWGDQAPYAEVLSVPLSALSVGWVLWALMSLYILIRPPREGNSHLIAQRHPLKAHGSVTPKPKYLPWIGMAFVIALLVSNITTQKISHFWGITVDVGTWFFPVTYIFNDIFTEVYGYAATRKYIWSAIAANLVMVLGFMWVVRVGASPAWAAFHEILWTVPRILMASLASFFLGEFLNAYVLAKLKIKMKGRWLPVRTISSTGVGVAIDSIAFVTIAFAGAMPVRVLVAIAAWEYVLKVGYEIIATPLTCWVIQRLKQAESMDVYDVKTRFSPFRWKV